ncbi:hypothetical protein CSAL01_05499 [Colletotrichum salicis]|uniref:Uncharacterized protein n=1 Tax=Colletotrichum salicis TaxID=1209931 RepID=A0A135UI09_9PEZI|nr:hypothetical protein CSAL01_05499 [Colletotrichum salicis]
MPFSRHGGLGRRPLPCVRHWRLENKGHLNHLHFHCRLAAASGHLLQLLSRPFPCSKGGYRPFWDEVDESKCDGHWPVTHPPVYQSPPPSSLLSHWRCSPESRPLLAHFLSMDLEVEQPTTSQLPFLLSTACDYQRCVETISSAGNVRLSPDSSTALARPRIHVNQTIKRTDGRWDWLVLLMSFGYPIFHGQDRGLHVEALKLQCTAILRISGPAGSLLSLCSPPAYGVPRVARLATSAILRASPNPHLQPRVSLAVLAITSRAPGNFGEL